MMRIRPRKSAFAHSAADGGQLYLAIIVGALIVVVRPRMNFVYGPFEEAHPCAYMLTPSYRPTQSWRTKK